MKAEDTVMSTSSIRQLNMPHMYLDWKKNLDEWHQKIARTQAEISFKAGRKEVVSRVSRIHSSTSDLKEIEKRIVAMLNEYHKEWGI